MHDENTHEDFDAVPSVVVVDPRFDAYVPLAAAAREGRLTLHLRSSGSEALRLARRLRVDAWLVADELDDMAGQDFVSLLAEVDAGREGGRVAMVGPLGSVHPTPAADGTPVIEPPISMGDLADLLCLPTDCRPVLLPSATGMKQAFVSVPVGIGAAVITVAILMMG